MGEMEGRPRMMVVVVHQFLRTSRKPAGSGGGGWCLREKQERQLTQCVSVEIKIQRWSGQHTFGSQFLKLQLKTAR